MQIKTKPVPAELQAVISAGLRQDSGRKMLTAAAANRSAKGAETGVTPSFPHDAYFMQLDDIAAGNSLAAAYPTGTRVLLSDAQQRVYSAAEVGTQGAELQLSQFDNGPFLQAMLEGVSQLAALPPTAENLDLRLLRIPALYIIAIWLHGEAPAPVDLVMPIGPTPAPLTAYQVYDAPAFLEQIRPSARQRMAQEEEQ